MKINLINQIIENLEDKLKIEKNYLIKLEQEIKELKEEIKKEQPNH